MYHPLEGCVICMTLILSWPSNDAFKPSPEWWLGRCACPPTLAPIAYLRKIGEIWFLAFRCRLCSLVFCYGLPSIRKYVVSMRLITTGVWFVVDFMRDQSIAWEWIWVVWDIVPKVYANHTLLSECVLECSRKNLWHYLNMWISLVIFAILHTFPSNKDD